MLPPEPTGRARLVRAALAACVPLLAIGFIFGLNAVLDDDADLGPLTALMLALSIWIFASLARPKPPSRPEPPDETGWKMRKQEYGAHCLGFMVLALVGGIHPKGIVTLILALAWSAWANWDRARSVGAAPSAAIKATLALALTASIHPLILVGIRLGVGKQLPFEWLTLWIVGGVAVTMILQARLLLPEGIVHASPKPPVGE